MANKCYDRNMISIGAMVSLILPMDMIRHCLEYFFFAETAKFSVNSNYFEKPVNSPLTLQPVEIIKWKLAA
jgi:hypothetical protein